MSVGHLAVGFMGKRAYPRPSLATYFVATDLPDRRRSLRLTKEKLRSERLPAEIDTSVDSRREDRACRRGGFPDGEKHHPANR